MKRILIILLAILPLASTAQSYSRFKKTSDRLTIQLTEGVLYVIPLTEEAVRIQWQKDNLKEEREFVLVNKLPVPAFTVNESTTALTLKTKAVSVEFNKQSAVFTFRDKNGKVFLQEKAGSRKLKPGMVSGQRCFTADLTFDSPADEFLFGLGQFQDGQYNLRNIPRKLIQVNSQIAIPFLYSSRGYGILWHQYGLTEFNPGELEINLVKKDSTGEKKDAEVTTTNGTQRVSQQQSVYTGIITLDHDGEYSMLLDLGNMENRHLLIIDGQPVIDQSNGWLPPAVGKLVKLTAGTHQVQVVCKASNTPRLSWKPSGNETSFRSPHAKSLDYVVFHGNNADEVIAGYRRLSGTVPMLPNWAYGYWQCRERYTSGEHLVKTVEEFRERRLPMDVIVQDWQYWGKLGWGVPQFDTTSYPNPEGFIKTLHKLHAQFSISVWENIDKKSTVAKEYLDKNLYIGNSPWIDIYKPEAQTTHWNALDKNLFQLGVDSWWMDATEPKNDALAGKQTYFGPGEFYRLTYPLFVSKAVYEGQRKSNPAKRVTTLTRSAFPGQQRFGTINWSGDIGWDWDTFKRQIVAGLNFSMTGMPYWTTDIGGFFRPGKSQYTDPAYHEILLRWFQWSTFNTIFRMHGYQTETEPWKYGDHVESSMRSMLNLRYQLMPYIYSEAWKISSSGSTMLRPMVMDFGKDSTAISQPYQYMFGKAMLVAPITSPAVKLWPVYLPGPGRWYNFWTGQSFTGGTTIQTDVSPDKIPVFVKAGSIIPMGPIKQHTMENKNDTLQLRVYTGADGQFDIYEDEGDNYNYEKGKYAVTRISWSEKKNTLTIGSTSGSFTGSLAKRTLTVEFIDPGHPLGFNDAGNERLIHYNGQKLRVVKD